MASDPEEVKTAFPVGSRWMCRLFVTTGPWKEVEVVEEDVQRPAFSCK